MLISSLLYRFLDVLFEAIYLILIIRVILSWIPNNPNHPVIEFIYRVTDLFLRPFQNIIPPSKLGGLDLSPIFAFITLNILQRVIFSFL